MSLVRVQQGEPRGTEFFSSSFFLVRKEDLKVSSSPCRTRKAALGNSPVDCCNRRGFAAAKRVQQGEPRENGEVPVLFFVVRKDGGKPERVSAVWLLVVVKLI